MCRLNFPQGCLTEHRSLGAVGDGWPMMVPFTQRGASLVRLGEIAMILELHRQGVSVSAIARQVGLDRKTVHKYIERGLAAVRGLRLYPYTGSSSKPGFCSGPTKKKVRTAVLNQPAG